MRPLTLALALTAFGAPLAAQGVMVPRGCDLRACPVPAPSGVIERRYSRVKVELVDRVLRYEVTETFVNHGARLGEADYFFPLPANAAFQDLALSINGEMVSGETMNAEQARSIYEEIVRRQRDPALVEWMGRGLLRTRIFPLNPEEEKKVTVRFQVVAPREGDALRVDYQRTTSGHTVLPDLPRMPIRQMGRAGADDEPLVSERANSFTLLIPRASQYSEPYSPTHELTVHDRGEQRQIDVQGDASEVTILLPVRHSREATITLLANNAGNEDGFALITLSPPALLPRRTPRDVTFVLDVSGSMAGRKMEQARAAGKQFLATLAPQDRFRLIDFSTDVRSFRDDFVSASPANLANAEKYLDQLEAQGSTNISGALTEALSSDPSDGRMPIVLFVTDGEPTVGERRIEAIADAVSKSRGSRRVFTFGLGADVNTALLEQLALDGRGTANFVRPTEDVERAVSVVASRITNPVVSDVRLHADGVRLEKMSPSGSIDLFAGEDLVLLARYHGDGEAELRFDGQTTNGPVHWTQTVEFPSRDRGNAFVPRLWATQRIGWLTAERHRNGASPELDEELRALGIRYGIPTELTSYLVQEPQTVARQGFSASPAPVPVTAQAAPLEDRASRFESAKKASSQRDAKSLSAADAVSVEVAQMSAAASAGQAGAASIPSTPRRVGDHLFVMRDGTWTDSRFRSEMQITHVKAYTKAYFALLEQMPELRPLFALGDRVIAAGARVAVQVDDAGSDTLTGEQIAAFRAGW